MRYLPMMGRREQLTAALAALAGARLKRVRGDVLLSADEVRTRCDVQAKARFDRLIESITGPEPVVVRFPILGPLIYGEAGVSVGAYAEMGRFMRETAQAAYLLGLAVGLQHPRLARLTTDAEGPCRE